VHLDPRLVNEFHRQLDFVAETKKPYRLR